MADHDAEFAPRVEWWSCDGKAVLVDVGGDDPWQSVRRALNVVSLDATGGDVEDPNSRRDDDVEAPDLSGAIQSLRAAFFETLTEQERYVVFRRLDRVTYAEIAQWCEPPLSGPSQARKIEQRALQKLRECLSAFHKLFGEKKGRS